MFFPGFLIINTDSVMLNFGHFAGWGVINLWFLPINEVPSHAYAYYWAIFTHYTVQ
jgi:hypothetical protein